MNAELLRRGLQAQRRRALIWSASLFALVVVVLAVWPSMSESGSLESLVSGMSPAIVSALGLGALATPAGFLDGNLYALLLPLLFATLGILNLTALTAGDEDQGRLELLLALPISRAGFYVSRFVSVSLVLAAVALVVGASVGFGGASLDMQLDTVGLVAATLGIFLLGTFHAALALALAGIGVRSGPVLGAAFGALTLGYLIYAFFPMIESLSGYSSISPWHWALGNQPLINGFDPVGTALLVGSAFLFVGIGLSTIRSRSIRTP